MAFEDPRPRSKLYSRHLNCGSHAAQKFVPQFKSFSLEDMKRMQHEISQSFCCEGTSRWQGHWLIRPLRLIIASGSTAAAGTKGGGRRPQREHCSVANEMS